MINSDERVSICKVKETIWLPRAEDVYPRKDELGRGLDLTGGVVWSPGSREVYWFSQAGVGLEQPDTQQATLGSAAILSEWLGVQGERGRPSEHVTHLCTGPGFCVKRTAERGSPGQGCKVAEELCSEPWGGGCMGWGAGSQMPSYHLQLARNCRRPPSCNVPPVPSEKRAHVTFTVKKPGHRPPSQTKIRSPLISTSCLPGLTFLRRQLGHS